MHIFITILLIISGTIVSLLVIAIFMKKTHLVKREITINIPRQQVFDFLKLLKNQEKFNKWAKADTNRNWNYKGTDGTVGFVISWNGDRKVRKGEKEIMKIDDGKRIETKIRFVRPLKTTADIIFDLESIAENQTKVTMSNAGKLAYPINLMIPIAERMFPIDMDSSLFELKRILE
jgi:hypothetical protein